MTRHLAIFVGDTIEKIFRGEKTIESRFSEHRVAPFGLVQRDDEIYLKQAGGPVVGRALVENVLYYDHLTGETIGKLRREYYKELAVPEQFWREKAKSHYATLIFLKQPTRFAVPFAVKKRDRRSWVLLNDSLG